MHQLRTALDADLSPAPVSKGGRAGTGTDTEPRPLKLALCASGGGHVRQILDLEPVWRAHDFFFVTEDLALGRSIGAQHRTMYVAHCALGQVRLGAPFRMIAAAVRNLCQSLRIVLRERPEAVLTTGAGSMFFMLLFARMAGARIILIDSFARFTAPSVFARIAGPLAHVRISQSHASADGWGAHVAFDPLRLIDDERPAKEPIVFATVGATLPFDRLVTLVAAAKRDGLLPEHVILQVGDTSARPDAIEEVHEAIPFPAVQGILQRADIVICHGGTGSLITALQQGCRVIAVPRLFELGEHYDDHQLEICTAFAARGLIEVVDAKQDLATALSRVRARPARMATTDTAPLQAHLDMLLTGWSRERRGVSGKSVEQGFSGGPQVRRASRG